eukprot:Gregarina_sp_Pseudo_9__2480@NODE_275_length_3315_cov_46_385531_g258_i0_p2_GENE_NODE_275_length_3315_cov_46_385531_g258_i0NODE_275_length_3315_cov_46_385531_g258_i0_p2_ORF_typecomplete_len128_score15_30C2/PF00168_30/3_6e162OGFeII_Oxy_2/PF13532_6/0_042_NODE_275_length_3315_cov_46_385531_g258_i026343017
MPALRVTVHEASGLPKKTGFLDVTDPYVVCQVGSQILATVYKKNAGESAEFNQVLTFDYTNEAHLLVHVKDHDTIGKDDIIASGNLPLTTGHLATGSWSGVLSLVPAKSVAKKANNPQVRMTLRYTP